jgi:hypothetical protein
LFTICADKSAGNQSSNFEVKKYANGSRYEGELKNGKPHGKGTYYYNDGNKYTGDWVDGDMSGQGVLTCANGERYEMRYSQMLCQNGYR